MNLSKTEILTHIKIWLKAWDDHNLASVMALMHDDVVFENWTTKTIVGKAALERAWKPWFLQHGNFLFIAEDIFVDEQEQKVLFRWRLEWPSLELPFKGKQEVRRGVDVLHFVDGKIREKLTYSKTSLMIDEQLVSLNANKNTPN
jgi:hypothetical protein